MLAALAQFVRKLVQERVTAGLASARSQGRIGGRPQADPAALTHARTLIAGGMAPSEAARTAGVSRSTLYKHGIVRKTSNGAGLRQLVFGQVKKQLWRAKPSTGKPPPDRPKSRCLSDAPVQLLKRPRA